MAGDYVPHSELKLVDWAERFVAFLEEHADDTPFAPGEVAAVRLELDEFAAAYDAHKAAQSAARSACRTKNAARKPLVDHLRSLAGQVETNRTVAAEVRSGAGSIRGVSPRHPKLGLSADRPHALIDISRRLSHVIRVMNERDGSVQRARPSDVCAAELWRQIGDETDKWELVDLVRGKPFVVRYGQEDGGKQVRYRLRWVTPAGQKGSWSATRTATVAA